MPGLEGIAQFFTIAPDPMLVVDAQSTILLANAHACALFGYKPDELVGLPVSSLLPERYRSAHAKNVEEYFRSPTVRSMGIGMELSALRADGSEFPVEISLSPYREKDATYALASIRDITERKQLEEAKRDSRRLRRIADEQTREALNLASRNDALRAIFEASPLGIVTATEDGTIDRWNRAAEQISGYSAKDVIGTTIWELSKMSEIEGEGPVHAADRVNRQMREVRDLQTRRRRRDGKVIEISVSSAPYQDNDGRNAGYVFLIDDVSDRTLMEQQLRQAQKMEAVGQLTGGVAHDFNNLLSVIICNLELLREKLPREPEYLELNDTAVTAALHGADLVRQILAFSRKQKLDPKRIDVNNLLQGMTRLLTRSLGGHIEVVLRTAPDAWPVIADPVQLETALVNLATNARDAMPQGGALVVQTENVVLDETYAQQFIDLKAGEYVMVSVSDSGHGMAPETVERAFDPFFTTKPLGAGSGLGLSMVFGFVKQSGGHARIYSEIGQGTTVRLYLPRAAVGQSASALSSGGVSKQYRSNGARILIVEDNQALAKSALRVLTDAGYDGTVAATTEEALNLLRVSPRFDVLFTDIILTRGENGIELAKEAVALNPGLKVLFSSGFSEAALLESGRAVVTGHFVAKPYRRDELLARIESLVKEAKR